MTDLAKPSEKPRWATDPLAAITTPPSGKQDLGWIVEYPPHQFFNWLARKSYDWINYFEAKTDTILGGSPETTLTIATGVITPTLGSHAVDTEAAAATDDLTNILTTNLNDGNLLLIHSVSAARVITIKHNAGGAGQVSLSLGVDLVLESPNEWVFLKRSGADWVQVLSTQVGSDATPFLGGDLDVRAKKLFSTTVNGDIVIEPNGTGALQPLTTGKKLGSASYRWDIYGSNANLTGNMTATTSIYTPLLDALTVGGTLNIGTSQASLINIGRAGATIAMYGSITEVHTTNTFVTDSLITLNDGGLAASGGGSGIEIEENAAITGYLKTSVNRNKWSFKSPNSAEIISLGTEATVVGDIGIVSNVFNAMFAGYNLKNSGATSIASATDSGAWTLCNVGNTTINALTINTNTAVAAQNFISFSGDYGGSIGMPGNSSAATILASNAYQPTYGANSWTRRSGTASASMLQLVPGGGGAFYTTAASATTDTFANFWSVKCAEWTQAGAWTFPSSGKHVFGNTSGTASDNGLQIKADSLGYANITFYTGTTTALIGIGPAGWPVIGAPANTFHLGASGGFNFGNGSVTVASCTPTGAWTFGPENNSSLGHYFYCAALFIRSETGAPYLGLQAANGASADVGVNIGCKTGGGITIDNAAVASFYASSEPDTGVWSFGNNASTAFSLGHYMRSYGSGAAVLRLFQASGDYSTIKFLNTSHEVSIGSNLGFLWSDKVYGQTVSGGSTVYQNSDGKFGTSTSIREAKINIRPLSNCFDWLKKLAPVYYQYRKQVDNKYTEEPEDFINMGLIYDEVIQVNPQLCFQKDGMPSGVEYTRLITPLLKAVQELSSHIEILEAEIAALKSA